MVSSQLRASAEGEAKVLTQPPSPLAPRPAPTRHITVRGLDIPVVFPSIRDLRLRLSAVILGIQILGQTVLNFKISIAQILVTMAVCAIIEIVVTLKQHMILAWPASAIQTGASVAFILRASGTRHGDLWSLRGIHFFILAGVLSLLSKYLIRRPNGRHVFNPSNFGIVAVLLLVGPRYVFSEHLWWDSFGVPILITLALIFFGGMWILKAVKMIPMAMSFLLPFAALTGIFALMGRSFYATWRPGGVSGMSYWLNIALSPEVIAYVFFMISDPQTSPKAPRARILYGVAGAAVTASLLFFQTTEFGIKVSILASLTLVCALVPFIEALSRRIEDRRAGAEGRERVPTEAVARPRLARRLAVAASTPAVAAVAIVAVTAPVGTLSLIANKEVARIERDLPLNGSTAAGDVPVHNPHRQ